MGNELGRSDILNSFRDHRPHHSSLVTRHSSLVNRINLRWIPRNDEKGLLRRTIGTGRVQRSLRGQLSPCQGGVAAGRGGLLSFAIISPCRDCRASPQKNRDRLLRQAQDRLLRRIRFSIFDFRVTREQIASSLVMTSEQQIPLPHGPAQTHF